MLRPLALISLVVVAMVVALLVFEWMAEEGRHEARTVARTQLAVLGLDSTALELLATRGPEPAYLAAEARAHLGEAHAAMINFRATSRDPSLTALVVRSYKTFDGDVVAALHLRGEQGYAGPVETSLVLNSLDAVQSGLQRALLGAEGRRDFAERLKDLGSAVTLVLGGLALAWVAISAERNRREVATIKTREEILRDSEARLRALLAKSTDLVIVLDAKGKVLIQSASIEDMLGWSVDEVADHDLREFLTPESAEEVDTLLLQAVGNPRFRTRIELRMLSASGRTLAVEANAAAHFNDPDIGGLLINARDLSERTSFERTLRHQELHDPLTKLPNRTLLEDRIDHAIDRSTRSAHSVGVLQINLDDFKDVNNSYGSTFGDRVLIETANRLNAAIRPEDSLARLRGDEFAVLIDEVESEDAATAVADRIVLALEVPIVIDATQVFAHASIGIVTESFAGSSANQIKSRRDALLVEADLAMHAAKRQGGSRYQLYAADMRASVRERTVLRSDLEGGLRRHELLLHYQPIVSLDTGTAVGAEALVRWQHPTRGLMPPAEFIPLAERTGMIVELGRWVLFTACEEAARWKTPAHGEPAPYVTVNVAALQLKRVSFVDEVRQALETTGLAPGRLVIEVTESSLIEDADSNEVKLHEIRQLGCSVAIDDFGTGYSSLSYLRRFETDILKVDKSFVDELGDPKGGELVAAMVAMGTSLGLLVVAEGIEREDQLQELRHLGCPLGQGYLFSRPVPPQDLESALAQGDRSVSA